MTAKHWPYWGKPGTYDCRPVSPVMSWPERVEALRACNMDLSSRNAELAGAIDRQASVITTLERENRRLRARLQRRSLVIRLLAGLQRAIG